MIPSDYYIEAARAVTDRMLKSGNFAWDEKLWQDEIAEAIAKEVEKATEAARQQETERLRLKW